MGKRKRCGCKKSKTPVVKIVAKCASDQVPPRPSLVSSWAIDFNFSETSDISIPTLTATGLFNTSGRVVESIAVRYFSPDRTPVQTDYDFGTILLPVAGEAGSMSGSEVYIFGDAGFDYTAVVQPVLQTSGSVATLITKFIQTTVDVSKSSNLILVAILRYLSL